MHEILIATHLTDDSLTLLNGEGDVTAAPDAFPGRESCTDAGGG